MGTLSPIVSCGRSGLDRSNPADDDGPPTDMVLCGRLREEDARNAFGMAFAVLTALLAFALQADPATAQVGFDRPGGDYASFLERSGDPALCATRCDQDARCRAWSFSYPATLAPNATCRLKSLVPPRAANPCCVAGVKGAAVVVPRDLRMEFSIDRPGGDYRSFETAPGSTGNACAASCVADLRCRAWTYLRPGYDGPVARCYLKDHLTPPRARPCCVSGVVR